MLNPRAVSRRSGSNDPVIKNSDIFNDPSPYIQYFLSTYGNIRFISGIGINTFAAVVQCAEQVIGFVSDGGDDLGVGVGGVESNKGVVGFVLVVGVDGFGESGEFAVLVKGRGFADENGGVFGIDGAFRHKHNVLRGIFFVESGDDVGNAFCGQRRIFHFHIIKA